MKEIQIYTDGACSFNPGPGGWGAVLIYQNKEKRISGFVDNTTNNRMELQAVISALKLVKEPCVIDIFTDSAYIYNAFTQDWINSWIAKGWKTAEKKAVQNVDLWQELLSLTSQHIVRWHKVKGHSDNEYNNICDNLARSEIDRRIQKN